ncbi:MAG: signal peptide peptidase SppA [Planctomycetota bacterium]
MMIRGCTALWMGLLLWSATGCGPATFVVGVAPGGQTLTTTPIERDGKLGSPHLLVLDVTGVIANADQGGLLSVGDNPVARLTEGLRLAANDDRVAAVVLRLNTPGGTVTASDMMYREVKRFKEKTGKPVVVVMMDVAASGGYYLACAADHVVAYPSTVTGSIGVVFQTLSVKPALDRIGIEAEALVSGPNKAAGSPLETLEPSQREILQGLVDRFYADFVTVVRENRKSIDPDTWDLVTDGRVFTGRRAYELGLVDSLGDIRDGITKAKQLADVKHADVLVAHRPLDYVSGPYSQTPPIGQGAKPQTQVNLLQINLDRALSTVPGTDAGMYYLWVPELP